MGKIKDWVNENSEYVRLSDGDKIEAIYMGYKVVTDRFHPDKEKIQYELSINGRKKYFESSSYTLAEIFDKCKTGEAVIIERQGEGYATKYKVQKKADLLENLDAEMGKDDVLDVQETPDTLTPF